MDSNPANYTFSNIKAVFQLSKNGDPQLPDNVCIAGLQEDVTVELLLSNNFIRDHNQFFRVLSDRIFIKECNYIQHSRSNKIMFGIAFSFISPAGDWNNVFKTIGHFSCKVRTKRACTSQKTSKRNGRSTPQSAR